MHHYWPAFLQRLVDKTYKVGNPFQFWRLHILYGQVQVAHALLGHWAFGEGFLGEGNQGPDSLVGEPEQVFLQLLLATVGPVPPSPWLSCPS